MPTTHPRPTRQNPNQSQSSMVGSAHPTPTHIPLLIRRAEGILPQHCSQNDFPHRYFPPSTSLPGGWALPTTQPRPTRRDPDQSQSLMVGSA